MGCLETSMRPLQWFDKLTTSKRISIAGLFSSFMRLITCPKPQSEDSAVLLAHIPQKVKLTHWGIQFISPTEQFHGIVQWGIWCTRLSSATFLIFNS